MCHPVAGRCHRAAADRQSRTALQPSVEVPGTHPVDQDHRPFRGCPWSGPSATTAPRISVRSPAAVRRGCGVRHLRRLPDPPVHSTAEREHTDLRLRWPAWPLRGTMRRHDLSRRLPGNRRSGTRRLVGRRGPRCGVQARLTRLISQQRYEEAAIIRRRLETLTRTAARFHRIRSLAACAEIVAARKVDLDWEIHVVRYGRLAGGARDTSGGARRTRSAGHGRDRSKATDPLPAAGIEETERIADWLERPGTRLIDISGDWMWPLHAVLDHEALVHHALGEMAAL